MSPLGCGAPKNRQTLPYALPYVIGFTRGISVLLDAALGGTFMFPLGCGAPKNRYTLPYALPYEISLTRVISVLLKLALQGTRYFINL